MPNSASPRTVTVTHPRTKMSLDFSPVKKSSSSRTTSSVFHTMTRSSYLNRSREAHQQPGVGFVPGPGAGSRRGVA